MAPAVTSALTAAITSSLTSATTATSMSTATTTFSSSFASSSSSTPDPHKNNNSLTMILLLVLNPVSLAIYCIFLYFIAKAVWGVIDHVIIFALPNYLTARDHRQQERQWKKWAIYPFHKRCRASEKTNSQAPIPIIGMVSDDNNNSRRGFWRWGHSHRPATKYAPGYISIVSRTAAPVSIPLHTIVHNDTSNTDLDRSLALALAVAQDADDNSSLDSGSDTVGSDSSSVTPGNSKTDTKE